MKNSRKVLRGALIMMMSALFIAAPASASDESNMADKIKAWEAAYNSGELGSIQALYAADGCRMPPNAQTANGSAAILAQLGDSKKAAPRVKLGLTQAETSGDQGYAMGTYAIMATDGSVIDRGKWMNVSRNIDGTWLIQCDIWNSDLPAPSAG